jgi:hypothetical protein
MTNPITELYKATLGPELANLVDKAMDKERDRIMAIIDHMEPGDCCWQYHSGHLSKTDIIKAIKGTE